MPAMLQAVPVHTPAPKHEPPSITEKQMAVRIVVKPDGTDESTTHVELRASNDAGAQAMAQMPISYSNSMDNLEIVDAATIKADGRRLPVALDAIFPQLPPGSAQIPMFSDERQKVVVFPDLASGDVGSYTYVLRRKVPLIPGNFGLNLSFPRFLSFQDVSVEVEAPSSMPLYVDTHDIPYSREQLGNNTVYKWHYSAPDPITNLNQYVSPDDSAPRLYVSSFTDYNKFSETYFALIAKKIVVTDKVRALADQITDGVADRRMQTQKIYEWVSRHIRYVAIVLASGGVIPHDVDTILGNGYGDCKDHAILFIALLKAKGIAGQPVIINADQSYSLPGVPVFGPLNHMITWLPEFGLYADTTAKYVPFGSLPFPQYGKPVIRLARSGEAMAMIPVIAKGEAASSVQAVVRLSDDGRFAGDSTVVASGAFSGALRTIAASIQSVGVDSAVRSLLGTGATGSFDFTPPEDLAPDYKVTGHFELEADPKLLLGEGFYMQAGPRLLPHPGDTLMGLVASVDDDTVTSTPCFSGHQDERLTLILPSGKRVGRLPFDRNVANDVLRYTSQWQTDGRTVSVYRSFDSFIGRSHCDGATRADVAAALRQIRDDYMNILWLADANGGASVSRPTMVAPSN